MNASYHTVRLSVRIFDHAALFAAAIAHAVAVDGMTDEDARATLSEEPEEGRYEVATGLGADGAQFGVLDTEAEEIGADRYDTEAKAEAARDALASTPVPNLNACLQMLFDPGVSPDGCTIQESSVEHDYDGEETDASL